ncbi:MAG: GntR family transcriptional regulator [candidate division WS1 bacterium]|jgi:GntR family transcriptional regulator of arabinose operon|nr:GntR family transcriptional regulator [candidate division WS1 bacterium]
MASKSSRVVKYQKVKETLAGEIERGKYALGERLPSEKQLAEQFEVSIITVRQAVEALARDGFVEKIQGSGTYIRRLRPAIERKIWAFVVPGLDELWYPSVAGGLEDVSRAAGIGVIILGTDLEEESGENVRRIVTMGADGLIIAPSASRRLDTTVINELSMAGVPFVFCGDYISEVDAPRVLWDYRGGARMGVEHLLAQGHRRIAFLSHPATNPSQAMWEGYRAALTTAGVDPWPPRGLQAKSFEQTDLYRAARDLLALWPRPTAVLCAHDSVAQFMCQAAADAGLKVPEELSVVGFYGFHMVRQTELPLTTVAVPTHELGQEAGKVLLRLMMGGTVNPEIVLPSSLRLGRTTAPPLPSETLIPGPAPVSDPEVPAE